MSEHKKIDVSLVEDEDIVACFEVVSESFGHDAPFLDNYFPKHDTPNGRIQGTNRLAAWKQHAPNSVFLKAVTYLPRSQGQGQRVIGIAVWTHMKEVPPQKLEDAENVEEFWPDHSDRKFMTGLWRDYIVPRTQAIKNAEGKGVYGT
jgi:hypothetical protein